MKDKTILVIEDDAEVLRVYKAVLGEFGQVRTAQTMTEARQLLDGVDLIILDYHLENETATFQEIVPELHPVAPILVCSGIPDPAVRAQGKDMGVAGYWNKGAGFEMLRSKVRAILSPAAAA
jgi:DNA-binding response OmpR family regulator